MAGQDMSRFLRSKNDRHTFTSLDRRSLLNRHRRHLTGFMLLEVILSVFIVVIGVVFVISSFITSIKAFKVSKVYFDALYLMEEKMWEYEESGEIEEGSDSGRFKDYKNAEWDVEAREIEEDLPLNETIVEVTVEYGDKERRFKIATYLYNKD